MNKKVRICNRLVGDQEPCFIIAEAGSNHNGNFDQAVKLIDVAGKAGADAVKFLLFRADKLYNKFAGESAYLQLNTSIYDLMLAMEMPYDWIPKLAEYCERNSIIFMSSVFDEESADQLDPYVPAYKIASYEMTHIPLIRYVAKLGKPVIISTGTAELEEVRATVREFSKTGNDDLILMQCTGCYPAPLAALNINAIPTIHRTFGIPVGFSDHSRDPLIGPLAATAVGARVIEKHYTLSNSLPGPDHQFSVEPEELSQMIAKIREVESALGTGEKIVQPEEIELRNFARRSIFAVKNICIGEVFSSDNVAVLRTGLAEQVLPPDFYDELIGKTARNTVTSGSAITRQDYIQ